VKLFLLGLAGIAVPFVKAAEEEPPLKVSVTLVQVDAVVTDKKGNYIKDLTAKDFKVLQNGRSQKITHFSYISTLTAPPTGNSDAVNNKEKNPQGVPEKGLELRRQVPEITPELSRKQVNQSIAIVVDDLEMGFESISRTQRALTQFVTYQKSPSDLVAIIRTSAGQGVLQKFTSDKMQLRYAIKQIRWQFPSFDVTGTCLSPNT
jgi:VWFA-related protein